jgi:hypothetical protein
MQDKHKRRRLLLESISTVIHRRYSMFQGFLGSFAAFTSQLKLTRAHQIEVFVVVVVIHVIAA